MVTTERIILLAAWGITIASLLFFIPKHKRRETQVSFLFGQTLTWFFGIPVVEWGWIEYPVNELRDINRTSLTFEYFVFPVIIAFFNLYYPEKGRVRQMIYYIAITSVITIFEVLMERYTMLIQYIHWTWYLTWGSVLLCFVICRRFHIWFFNKNLVK